MNDTVSPPGRAASGQRPFVLDNVATIEPLLAKRAGVEATERSVDTAGRTLWEQAFTHSPAPSYITDGPTGRCEYVNEQMLALLGLKAEEVVGRTVQELKLWSGLDQEDEGLYEAMGDGLQKRGAWEGKALRRRLNGQALPVSLSIHALPNENGVATHHITVASDISRVQDYETRLQQLALYDPLTGLANRLLLMERGGQALLQAERNDEQVGLLLITLDGYARIIKGYGQTTADNLLKLVANSLALAVRASDTVAYLQAGEFAVLLPRPSDAGAAQVVASKIFAALSEPFLVDGRQISIGAHIGIARYPSEGLDMPALLRAATDGLAKAQSSGPNKFATGERCD